MVGTLGTSSQHCELLALSEHHNFVEWVPPSLAERLVVRLDAVHDDAPLSLDVDGAQRGHV